MSVIMRESCQSAGAAEDAEVIRQSEADPHGWKLQLERSTRAAAEQRRRAELYPELVEALNDINSQCRKWAPNIDQSRARAVLAKCKEPAK